MEFLRTWLVGILCAALIAALAEELAPRGGASRVVRLTGGLLLLLAVVRPVLSLEEADMAPILAEYRAEAGGYSQALELVDGELQEAFIAEETAAYILDKAEGLGMACQVEAACRRDGAGEPYPGEVWIAGTFTEEQRRGLSRLIRADLAIPEEDQHFERTEEP